MVVFVNVYRSIYAALALAAFTLFPIVAGAVTVEGKSTIQLAPVIRDIQDIAGANFRPAHGGMEIVSFFSGSVLAAAGMEVGDTILSINRTPTWSALVDITSLGNALVRAHNSLKADQVVVIDHRTGEILFLDMVF
jgi:S1-C subfamily serine protease